MHCLGCPSARGETVEEAWMVHGVNADDFLKQVNHFLEAVEALRRNKPRETETQRSGGPCGRLLLLCGISRGTRKGEKTCRYRFPRGFVLGAEMIAPGARVADIGTDHGYLPVYLLRAGRAASVLATDLRRMPLTTPGKTRGAVWPGGAHRLWSSATGWRGSRPLAVDTIVCAGMGERPHLPHHRRRALAAGCGLYADPAAPGGRSMICAGGCRPMALPSPGDAGAGRRVSILPSWPCASGRAVRQAPGRITAPGVVRERQPALGAYLARQRRNLKKRRRAPKRPGPRPTGRSSAILEAALAEITQMERDDGNGT